jgi:hypothetical protein
MKFSADEKIVADPSGAATGHAVKIASWLAELLRSRNVSGCWRVRHRGPTAI